MTPAAMPNKLPIHNITAEPKLSRDASEETAIDVPPKTMPVPTTNA